VLFVVVRASGGINTSNFLDLLRFGWFLAEADAAPCALSENGS